MTKIGKTKISDIKGLMGDFFRKGEKKIFLLVNPRKQRGNSVALMPVVIYNFIPYLEDITVHSLENPKKAMSINVNTAVFVLVTSSSTICF